MRKLLRRLWYVLTERRRQAELLEEMAFHREMKERELSLARRDSAAAEFDARRALGNVALAQDESRDQWIGPGLDGIRQDIRFAVRILKRDWRFTATAVLALALGCAVNTTIFGIINTAILRDLPFEDPDQLVSIGTRNADSRAGGLSLQDFEEWGEAATTLAGMAVYVGGAVNLSDGSQAPERLRGGAFVSPGTFGLLRVQPLLGRDFIAADDRPGATPVVIVGYGLWQRRFNGDKTVLGRTIRVNDVPSTVIGVMPERFAFPFSGDVWQPLAMAPAAANTPRDRRIFQGFGRLAGGKTIGQARAELDALASRTAAAHPETNSGVTVTIEGMNDARLPGMMPILATLMAFVLLVLFIACANVANLLLARSAWRSREMAIRASLGATRFRIARQLLLECGLLAIAAAALGVVLSIYGIQYLGRAFGGRELGAPPTSAVMPYWVDLSMNELVFFFAAGLSMLTTVLAGLAPAVHVARASTNGLLKEGGRGGGAGLRTRRWTSGFVIAQIALTIVLLTGAGLMLRSFVQLYRADRVVDTSALITARISLSSPKYASPEARRHFLERLDARLSASGAFLGATATTAHPFSWTGTTRRIIPAGQDSAPEQELPSVGVVQVDGHHFDVLRLPIVRGRSPGDPAKVREAVIDRRFVQMFFPDRDPVGQPIRLTAREGPRGMTETWTVVGVVPTVPYNLGARETPPVMFVPLAGQATPATWWIIVRTPLKMTDAVSQLREEVRALDSDLPVYYAHTLEEAFADARYAIELVGGWFGALAAIAVLLATVGMFAITRHAVTERRQEIGVRIALGARSREVVWLFLRRTMTQLALGVTVGLAGALAAGRFLSSLFTRTDPYDPLTLASVSALIILVALAATWLPARRATRIDPIVALRYE